MIDTQERRRARVATGGQLAALSLLRGTQTFRLAGSDDPALDLLLQAAGPGIEIAGRRGSFYGLLALWQGRADGAVIHLDHSSGIYNAPYAQALLSDQQPTLVHLWRREQGILLPEQNPRAIATVSDLSGCRLAKRPAGTGTRILLDRLLLNKGIDPDSITGPELDSHLEVGLAVASGIADAGIGVRSLATTLALDFVPLHWEHYDLILRANDLGGIQPLLKALNTPQLHDAIQTLAGYDTTNTGTITRLD